MQFSSIIEKIMPDVRLGSTEPFVIYRDGSGDWHCDYTQNQYGEPFDWVEGIKDKDPLAGTFNGSDFANGSHPYVYDKVLAARLWAEYENTMSGDVNMGELRALVNFLEDNMGELSSEACEYITGFYKPLNEIYKMVPASLIISHPVENYDEDRAWQAFEIIEDRIETLIQRSAVNQIAAEPAPAKRVIDGYEEKQNIRVAGQLVILAENEKADEPYMVCYCKWDNPLGMDEYYNICVTDDYVEAMQLYAHGILSFTKIIEAERGAYSAPMQLLTAADCIPGSLDEDLKDKLIVIKPEALAPEYRRSERQLKICTGGFGTAPNSRGNAVFCKDLYSGKESRFERYDVAGVIDPAKLPEWAMQKIALTEAVKQPPQKTKAADKKPSLLGNLDKNKQKVERDKAANKDKPATKKRGDTEVTD